MDFYASALAHSVTFAGGWRINHWDDLTWSHLRGMDDGGGVEFTWGISQLSHLSAYVKMWNKNASTTREMDQP